MTTLLEDLIGLLSKNKKEFLAGDDRILSQIYANPAVSLEFIENCDIISGWCSVSRNPNVTIQFLNKYPTKPWNWEELSKNLSFTIIRANLTRHEWDWKGISANPTLCLNFLQQHVADYDWDWFSLSRNPCVTIEFLNATQHYKWNWSAVSQNPNITTDFVRSTLHKPWAWYYLARNSSIPVEFFIDYQNEEWDLNDLYGNKTMSEKWKGSYPLKHPVNQYHYQIINIQEIIYEKLLFITGNSMSRIEQIGHYAFINVHNIHHLIECLSRFDFGYNKEQQSKINKEVQKIMAEFICIQDLTNIVVNDYYCSRYFPDRGHEWTYHY